jgi:hypothetical protein
MARTSKLAELAVIDQAVVAARQRVRQVEVDHAAAKADAVRARDALVEACARQDTAAESKLTTAKHAAEARAAEPWPERVAGAKRAADRAIGERQTWIRHNYYALIEEVRPEAEAVAQAIRDSAEAVQAACAAWSALDHRIGAITTGAGVHRNLTPRLDQVQNAARTFARDMGDVPLPLPQDTTATWDPTHDFDAKVRKPAQEESRRKHERDEELRQNPERHPDPKIRFPARAKRKRDEQEREHMEAVATAASIDADGQVS